MAIWCWWLPDSQSSKLWRTPIPDSGFRVQENHFYLGIRSNIRRFLAIDMATWCWWLPDSQSLKLWRTPIPDSGFRVQEKHFYLGIRSNIWRFLAIDMATWCRWLPDSQSSKLWRTPIPDSGFNAFADPNWNWELFITVPGNRRGCKLCYANGCVISSLRRGLGLQERNTDSWFFRISILLRKNCSKCRNIDPLVPVYLSGVTCNLHEFPKDWGLLHTMTVQVERPWDRVAKLLWRGQRNGLKIAHKIYFLFFNEKNRQPFDHSLGLYFGLIQTSFESLEFVVLVKIQVKRYCHVGRRPLDFGP